MPASSCQTRCTAWDGATRREPQYGALRVRRGGGRAGLRVLPPGGCRCTGAGSRRAVGEVSAAGGRGALRRLRAVSRPDRAPPLRPVRARVPAPGRAAILHPPDLLRLRGMHHSRRDLALAVRCVPGGALRRPPREYAPLAGSQGGEAARPPRGRGADRRGALDAVRRASAGAPECGAARRLKL